MSRESAALPLDSPGKGILFVLANASLFSVHDVVFKGISGTYPVHELMFLRSAVALPTLLLLAHLEGEWRRLRTRRLGLQLLRGCSQLISFTFYYMALAALPLADTVTLFLASPLFVTALSVPLLGEKVGVRRWLAVCMGFVGMVLMMRPAMGMAWVGLADAAAGSQMSLGSQADLGLGPVFGVLSALSFAFVPVLTRHLGSSESASSMAVYATTCYLVVSAGIGLAVGDGHLAGGGPASVQFLLRAWVVPSGRDAGLLVMCGVLAALAFYATSQAYRLTRATVLAPFAYASVPLAVLMGYLFWGDLPTGQTLMGMLLILGAGLWVAHRESVTQRARAHA